MRKPDAPFYTREKRRYNPKTRNWDWISGKDGTLLSKGQYATHWQQEDLPPTYMKAYLYGFHGWLRTDGVKDIKYRPNLYSNHLFKDDCLFISYGQPLTPDNDELGTRGWYKGHDLTLWGCDIPEAVKLIKQNSGIDTSQIEEQIRDKIRWLREQFPEDAEYVIGDWVYEP